MSAREGARADNRPIVPRPRNGARDNSRAPDGTPARQGAGHPWAPGAEMVPGTFSR
jgi:hypothetical protein